jgi:hypothetical protein
MNKTLIVIAVALSVTGVAKAAPRTPCLPMQPCPMADIRWLAADPGTYAIFRREYQAYAARPDVMESLRKIQDQISAIHAQADAEKVARQVAKQKADQDAAAERKRLDAARRADPVAFQAAIDAKNAASQAAYQAKSAKVAPAQPVVAKNFDIDEDIRKSYAGQFGGGAGTQEVKKEAPMTTLTGHYRADGLMVYDRTDAVATAPVSHTVNQSENPQCHQLLGMLATAPSQAARQVIIQNLNVRGCSIPQEAMQHVAHPAYDQCVAVLQQAGANDTSRCDHLYYR